MGKRGILRIIEAAFAVLIVIGVLLAVSVDRSGFTGRDLGDLIPGLLDEIAKDNALRTLILTDETAAISGIKSFVGDRVKGGISYEVNICPPTGDGLCPFPPSAVFPVDAEVFSGERIISATVDTYQPKKVKLFLWS